jgi:hypothetical protein
MALTMRTKLTIAVLVASNLVTCYLTTYFKPLEAYDKARAANTVTLPNGLQVKADPGDVILTATDGVVRVLSQDEYQNITRN